MSSPKAPIESPEAELAADLQGLKIAEHLLAEGGYQIWSEFVGGSLNALLGENHDNLVLVTAVTTVEDLLMAEPLITARLVEVLQREQFKAKRWDGYAMLISGQAASQGSVETIFGVTYNLRQVRRIVKVGVEPTINAYARAMRPILPLTQQTSADLTLNPIFELEKELREGGGNPELISEVMAEFQSSRGQFATREELFESE